MITDERPVRQPKTLQELQADRSRRAYEVAETYRNLQVMPGIWSMISPQGNCYTVDANEGWRSCPDHERHPELRCKHLEAATLLTLDDQQPTCPDCGGEVCFCPNPSDEELCGIASRERRISQAKTDRVWMCAGV